MWGREERRHYVIAHEIIDVPMEDPQAMMSDQYFVMYQIPDEEGQAFNPEKVVGVWGATAVATILARFRQTGILVVPLGPPGYGLGELVVENAMSVFVVKPEAILYKLPRMMTMSEKEHEEYLKNEELVRANIENFKKTARGTIIG